MRRPAAKERSLAGALLAAVAALLLVTPSLANADRAKQTRPLARALTAELAPGRTASYAETRYRVSTTPERPCDRVEAALSRFSCLGYSEPSSALVVGSLAAPKSAGGGASRIAELRAKVGDLQEAWHAYQARPDSAGYSLSRWKRSVDTLRMNFKQGRLGQTLSGLPGEAFETPYGWRFVDVAPATEVKTGYATLSKFVRRQILKDVWLRRNVAGYTPLWEFRGTASAPLLERLRTFGIPYRFQ